MYYSLLYSHNRTQKEFTLSMYDINDMIDENEGIGGKFWNEFKIAFNNSMYKDVPIQEVKKKAVNKKV